MATKKLIVRTVSIIGWGGGPGMTYGISYEGEYEVKEDIGGMLKLTALTDGKRTCSNNEKIKEGYVFYVAPNTIREMVEKI